MPICMRCGEIVHNTDDSICKDILKFCMTYNVSPSELVDLASGRFAEVSDAFNNLPDDSKATILSLTDLLSKARSGATSPAPKVQSKSSKGKGSGSKKK